MASSSSAIPHQRVLYGRTMRMDIGKCPELRGEAHAAEQEGPEALTCRSARRGQIVETILDSQQKWPPHLARTGDVPVKTE